MTPGRLQRRVRRAAADATAAHPFADRIVRQRAFALRGTREPVHDLIVAAPGAGNIGDRAMLEALAEASHGPAVVIVRNESDLGAPLDGVEVVALPALIFGPEPARRRDLGSYLALVADARSVSVIGADMLDGRYTLTGSVRRTLLAELGARAGVPTRLIGFSWNAAARPAAVRAVQRAARCGALPLLRDPESAARIRSDGVHEAVDAADVVFSSTSLDAGLTASLALPTDYAVVNVSGLVARTVDQVPEYLRVVRHLVDAGLGVVLLPHVLRGSSDDLAACRSVAQAVDDPRVLLVDRAGSPSEVRGLVDGARLVVTGRMHLAVMALSRGVPAITLATQGKVEGMMRRFGVPELCVQPRPGMAGQVTGLIDDLLGGSSMRTAITTALPAVRELAERNTDHLMGSRPEAVR